MDKKTFTKSQALAYIRKHWAKKTVTELSDELNIPRGTINDWARKARLPKHGNISHRKTIELKHYSEDIKIKNERASQKIIEDKYKLLLRDYQTLKKELDSSRAITPINVYQIPSYTSRGENEATAVILMSDGHFGEVIHKEEVSGLNEYNPLIAQKRSDEFFQISMRITEVLSRDIPIKHAVLALLGDFINNMLFEDAQETNSLLPTKELMFAQRLLASGIEYYLKNSSLNFTVVCHPGNHGRTQKKPRITGATGHSYEYLMYHNLAFHFKNDPRVKFIIPESYLSYLKVYEMTLAFHHGEAVRYYGGIGSLTLPMYKAIGQWDQARKADLYCNGHFHQSFDGGSFVSNGSIVGWNAYATSIKAKFEKPKQIMFLIDKKRGKTITAPILFSV